MFQTVQRPGAHSAPYVTLPYKTPVKSSFNGPLMKDTQIIQVGEKFSVQRYNFYYVIVNLKQMI